MRQIMPKRSPLEIHKLCWNNVENKLTANDSYILLEFIPHERENIKSFALTYNQVCACEKMSWDESLEVWWVMNIGDNDVVELRGVEWTFYLPLINHKFSYNQKDLFGNEVKIDEVCVDDCLAKFFKILNKIQPWAVLETTSVWFKFHRKDEIWKYTIWCRNHLAK